MAIAAQVTQGTPGTPRERARASCSSTSVLFLVALGVEEVRGVAWSSASHPASPCAGAPPAALPQLRWGPRCCTVAIASPPPPENTPAGHGSMVNNAISSIRKFRKKWQDKVTTWFNQPARKERRRAGECGPRSHGGRCRAQLGSSGVASALAGPPGGAEGTGRPARMPPPLACRCRWAGRHAAAKQSTCVVGRLPLCRRRCCCFPLVDADADADAHSSAPPPRCSPR